MMAQRRFPEPHPSSASLQAASLQLPTTIQLDRVLKHGTVGAVALLASVLMQSCGGGAPALFSAGVGTGGTGVVQGLVTGFGSVFVDGKEYLTSPGTKVAEADSSGTSVNGLLKLGDRIQATLDGSGNVVSADILPALQGPVTQIPTLDPTSGDYWLQVDSQWVRIVTQATNTPLGLTTVLAGCTLVNSNFGTTSPLSSCMGAFTSQDEVEVHGTWELDPTRNSWILIASRLEIKAAFPAATPIQISGVVTQLGPGANQLTLNSGAGGVALQGTLPSGVIGGQTISAWVSRSNWNAYNSTGPGILAATLITNTSLVATAANGTVARLSGLVSSYDSATNTALIQGTLVTLPASYQGKVADGAYVMLTGALSSAGLDAATSYPTHQGDDRIVGPSPIGISAQAIELKGGTNNWNGVGNQTLVLQGTAVNTVSSTSYAGCTNFTVNTLVFLDVVAQPGPPGQPATATTVSCSSPSQGNPDHVTDLHGLASNLSATASGGSLTLTLSGENAGVYTVSWNSNTFIDPTLLAPNGMLTLSPNQTLDAAGTVSNGQMAAMVIRPYQTNAPERNANND